MADNAKRAADRLRVLLAIYEQTEDDTRKFVLLWDIRDALGLTDDEMANAVNFLESRGLIEPLRTMAGQLTPMQTRITHAGVNRMELAEKSTPRPRSAVTISYPQPVEATNLPRRVSITAPGVRAVAEAKRVPDKPTPDFPAYISVQNATFVMAPMTNSSVQNAGDRAKQKSKVKGSDIGGKTRSGVEDVLRLYRETLPELAGEQTPKAVEVIAEKAAELQKQVESPNGKKNKLRKAAESLKEILEVGVGGAVTAGLLAALHGIPW